MDEEEAISTDDSGAPPVVDSPQPEADNSGAPPVADTSGEQEAIPTDDGAPPAPDNAGAPQQKKRFGPLGRLVSYLMGEDAVPPAVLTQAAQQIDPNGQMSPSDRNLMVAHDAATRGGPDAGWKIVQANRVAYNAKQSFAYAALNGNQQKPPDINAAIDAANQAAEHVLDGSNVQFAAGQGGVTATVKSADGNTQAFNLTPDQFRQYLNPGRDGQFDRQMQKGGIARTLTNITQNQQRVSSVNDPAVQQKPKAAPAEQLPDARIGGKVDGFGPALDPSTGYSEQLQRRAFAMFPPGSASDRERQEWMAKQDTADATLKNKVDVAEANAEGRQNVAATNAGARVTASDTHANAQRDVAETKRQGYQYASDQKTRIAQIAADAKTAAQGDKNAQARIESARKTIATKRVTGEKLTPEEQETEKQLNSVGQSSLQGQRGQAPAQQNAPAQGVPPPEKRVVNQIYNTPKGPHRWMGNGWQPVQ